ncbi:transcriptional regulatory [Fusarium mundagurra]|uniref:Transcriptional regulatory n=1 Tax=Fusarium mundagurra TaxID=1567541 RepID=A0A8H6DAW4_9HYPO|nr:transcriptional regulatory [Fusarium mundagurra]
MEFIAAGVSWALSKAPPPQKILGRLGLASLVAQNSWPELSSKLSPQASIVLPDDSSFGGLIRYANEHGIPFLARSGGHGATEALQLAKDVIVVDLRDQNDVEIAGDGKSARIGGGASVKKVVNELWTAGKQTVTGICECVGVSAPAFGGGHGWLQGQYGLASDQVISARVVLPNGDAVTASEDSNPDLFWALRGAGHNFGIVTEWEYRIYDINNPKWSYEIFIFLGEKLEDVLELTNKMMKTQPPHLTYWIYIVNIPEIDPDKPIIWYAVISDGAAQEARDYAKSLHDLGPINVNAGEASMPELAAITLMSDDSVGCAKGFTGLRYPIGLKTYDLLAVRKVFNEIADISKRIPEFAGSFFLLEGYSTHGVKAIDAKNSAFPHRDDEILVTPYILYKPNATLDGLAQEHGEKLRRHLLEASGDPQHLRAYVNYAHGFESLEEMYGHETWRIEKLKALKKKCSNSLFEQRYRAVPVDNESTPPFLGTDDDTDEIPRLKCDRDEPCSNCVARNVSCQYAPWPRGRVAAQRRDSRQNDLSDRVRHLEQLLGSIVQQLPAQQGTSNGSPSIKSPASTYVTASNVTGSNQGSHHSSQEGSEVKPGSHWSAICHEVEHIREHLDESHEASDLGIVDQAQSQVPLLLGPGRVAPHLDDILADVPPKHITDRLVSRYFTSTEPSIFITHSGEFEGEYKRFWNDPSSVSVQWIGMLFGILATGTFLYIRSQDELPGGMGSPLEVAESFQQRCTDCLILSKYSIVPGKYTLETLLFNIHGEFVRRRDAQLGVWILTGIAIRLAMRMGYHRDPDNYPRISPFHGEMRRRVWGVLQQLDILTSCQLGLPSLIQESQCDTRLPRNINDEDFGPECTQLPPPRPETQGTGVLYTRVKVKMMTIFRTIFNQVSLGKTEDYNEIMALDQKLHHMHQSMPTCYKIAKLEDCFMVPPYLLIRRYNLELLFQKARCTLHRHHMTKAYHDPKYNYSRAACVDSAMTVLGHQASILKEVQVGGLLYNDRWFLTSLERHDFSLASMVVCVELGMPPEQQNPELVGYSRESMIEALKTSQAFWAAIKAVSAEAKQAYDMLTVMLKAVTTGSKDESMPSAANEKKAPAHNGNGNGNGHMNGQNNMSETPFSTEFQGIEAMLNSSDGVDWRDSGVWCSLNKISHASVSDTLSILVSFSTYTQTVNPAPQNLQVFNMPAQLVIFDFDGTLFDTHQAISHSIKLTFDSLLPASAPAESEVQKLIGSGLGLREVLQALHTSPDSFDEDEWTSTYRRFYNDEGQKLVSAFPGAKELLNKLKKGEIPVAIVSNKGVAAVEAALDNNGIDTIPGDLIVGDNTPGATRKPDTGSFENVLLPALKARGFTQVDASRTLVVGDTEADVKFAANIGAKSVWCRYGYGERSACEKLEPHFTVDSLDEVAGIVDRM